MVTGIQPGTTAARNPRSIPIRLRDVLEENKTGDLEAQAGGVRRGATPPEQLEQYQVNRGANGEH